MMTTLQMVRAAMGEGRPYTDRARTLAIEYAFEQRARGTSLRVIASRIGISAVTLTAWVRSRKVFEQVEITRVAPAVAPTAASGTLALVDVNRGLRVEGADVESILFLLERLR